MTDEQIKAAIAKWDKMPGAAGFWDVREALLETLRLRAEVRKWRDDAIQANKDALAAEQEIARLLHAGNRLADALEAGSYNADAINAWDALMSPKPPPR